MFVPIANEPRNYAWGSRTLLAEYLGAEPSGEPEAELWLGAHPGCPARVTAGEHAGTDLAAALDADGRAQPTMLLKVLAAAQPLSLQVHPDTSRARAGCAREDAAGIPRDAPHRNYRDPHAKPELIVAVTPFDALSGFRPHADSIAVFDALAAVDESLRVVAARVHAGDALAWLLSGGAEVRAAAHAAAAAGESIAERFPRDADTIAMLSEVYPGDPGILVALMLHRVTLAPGEALFLPAGNMHAYLAGLGIELMGPSDNVLRGGLTPKHVDVQELLGVVDTTPLDDPRLPVLESDGALRYRPDAPFELRRITGLHEVGPGRGLVLAVAPTRVEVDGEAITMSRGDAGWVDGTHAVVVESTEAWLALESDTPNAEMSAA